MLDSLNIDLLVYLPIVKENLNFTKLIFLPSSILILIMNMWGFLQVSSQKSYFTEANAEELFASVIWPRSFSLSVLSFSFTHSEPYKSPVLPACAHITSYSAVLSHKICFRVPTPLLPSGTSRVVNQRHISSGPQSWKRDGRGTLVCIVLRITAPWCIVPPDKYFMGRTIKIKAVSAIVFLRFQGGNI